MNAKVPIPTNVIDTFERWGIDVYNEPLLKKRLYIFIRIQSVMTLHN